MQIKNEKIKVSLIIPTKNSERTLGACLESIKKQSYDSIEIIVVDNFSHDTTIKIAKEYAVNIYQKGPERSAQRNYGVSKSSGTYVLIIDSDMKLDTHVVQECVTTLQEHEELLGLVIPEESFGTGFRAQCKKLERSCYVGVDRMEAARCFRKETFLEMGGYDTENIGTEDYDLPQRIQQTYGKIVIGRINSTIYHDEGKLSIRRSCQKKFYYGQRLHAYVTKDANKENFEKQSGLIRRYGLFFSQTHKLAKNPLVGIGMLFLKSAELVSGACGMMRGKVKKIDNIYE